MASERLVSLHHINALEIEPMDFIAMAAQAGARQISIFSYAPELALPGKSAPVSFPLFTPPMVRDARQQLSGHGIEVVSMEFFPIAADISPRVYEAALATGRELGARRAVTHIHDTDKPRAIDRLGELCDLAASLDVTLGLEFMGLTPGCNSIGDAAFMIDQVGRRNIGIGLDPLHFVRTGGTVADISALASRYFAYAQICDGRGTHRSDDYIPDALDRLLPGDGDFPLVEIFNALPRVTPLEIEVPREARSKHIEATQHFLSTIVERCSAFVNALEPSR